METGSQTSSKAPEMAAHSSLAAVSDSRSRRIIAGSITSIPPRAPSLRRRIQSSSWFASRYPDSFTKSMNISCLPMRTRLLFIASLIAIPLFSATDWESAGKRWWAHVQFLASDELEGRLTGSEGYRKAADYVAKQFKAYGLAPAGTKG